ncbi:hypothetical protein [Micromonospora echinofusca]|uniref:hypothetical protein n=1 Tax=Micromonospora echinofusca TaxID=47858 RepID=UPI0012FDA702|nr:hypothetical protein [Micromonospora echinofusca]
MTLRKSFELLALVAAIRTRPGDGGRRGSGGDDHPGRHGGAEEEGERAGSGPAGGWLS